MANAAHILNDIAQRYESTPRILMEYIDNAIDDAEAGYRKVRDPEFPALSGAFLTSNHAGGACRIVYTQNARARCAHVPPAISRSFLLHAFSSFSPTSGSVT